MTNSTCAVDLDPQGPVAQTLGYVAAALVVGHPIPSAYKIWRTRNPSAVPSQSLAIRVVLSAVIAGYGVAICQIPQIVSGTGSLVVFAVIIAAKVKFKNAVHGEPDPQTDAAVV
jgi:uncharacterized protein with PQ loop repeat